MHVTMDEDVAMMDEQVNTATQSSNVNPDSQSSSVEVLEEQHHHHHQGLAVKRHQEFPVEDGLERLPKYPKLDTSEQSFEPREGQTASSLSSDELCDETPEENGNYNENAHPTDTVCTNSSEAHAQLPTGNLAVELESDADSVAISPQKEISNDVLANSIEEKESHETINNVEPVPKVLRVQNLIALRYVTNHDLENNNISGVVSLGTTIKQSNSQQYINSSEENTDEPVNVISIPENSSLVEAQEEYLHQEESNESDAHNNNGVTEQETEAVNYLYAAASQSSRKRNLKTEYSSSQDQSSQSSFYQDQNEDGQPTGNQAYPPMLLSQVIDNQLPSTSRGFEENTLGLSMSSSVSDLAQLVVSLKCDVQKLTERVDHHEVALKAIIQGNSPANLAVLFTPNFKEKYNLKVPFTKLEDFEKFNEDLAKDHTFCQEFITNLTEYVDKSVTLSKNILNMVKQYMSKELAILFNASKPAPNKMVLKDYLFCKCLLRATQITLQGDKLLLEHEKLFMKNLGHVISGAKGWHNHNEEQS